MDPAVHDEQIGLLSHILFVIWNLVMAMPNWGRLKNKPCADSFAAVFCILIEIFLMDNECSFWYYCPIGWKL